MEKMYCAECRKEIEQGQKFCPNCGTALNETSQQAHDEENFTSDLKKRPVERVYCSKCGKEIEQGQKFCPDCGTAIGETSQQAHGEENSTSEGFDLRKMMWIISAISGITSLIVYIYAHCDDDGDFVSLTYLNYDFWTYGPGPMICLVFIVIAICALLIGIFCTKEK